MTDLNKIKKQIKEQSHIVDRIETLQKHIKDLDKLNEKVEKGDIFCIETLIIKGDSPRNIVRIDDKTIAETAVALLIDEIKRQITELEERIT